MTHGSVFSCIGGFDLAAQWVGWENAFHCEIDPFGKQVLKYYWPKAESFGDIKKSDFTKYANKIDVFTGGFPCQPWSTCGDQLGENDERHLFPEMFRAIKEIKPRWIVAENVYGLTQPKFRETLENICSSLENEGYSVQPVILPASSVKAPHQRYRLWIIAHSDSLPGSNFRFGKDRCQESKSESLEKQRERFWNEFNGVIEKTVVTHTESERFQERNAEQAQYGTHATIERYGRLLQWQNFPTQSPVRDGDDGLSLGLVGITFPRWCKEAIKAGGNAIVPVLAHEIFKTIEQYEKQSSSLNQ